MQENTNIQFGVWKKRDPFTMKNVWLVLMVIAVVLLVTAESRKDRKPGKKGGVGKGKGGNRKPFKRG